MICRNCGTEIADKAIICYRCGTSTSDPVRQPAAVRPRRRGRLLPLVALVLLVLLGLFLGQAGQTVLPAGKGYGLAAGVAIAVAIVLLVIRIIRRR
jgi:zinc-ribbon domain